MKVLMISINLNSMEGTLILVKMVNFMIILILSNNMLTLRKTKNLTTLTIIMMIRKKHQ